MGNPVVHFELIGPDPGRLREFYGELFGWNAPAGAPVADRVSAPDAYSFIEADEQASPAAGGIGGGEGFTNHAIFYVGVADVASTLAEVVKLGGTVALPPQRNESGNVAVAHFLDPAGNLVGIAGPLA